MGMLKKLLVCLIVFSCWSLIGKSGYADDSLSFRTMTWNIWHGGREDGEKIGPQRVVEVIRQSKADIVAMQETYGSGEWISEQLGFHFHPRGTNVSIHSRYPVLEDISVFENSSVLRYWNCRKVVSLLSIQFGCLTTKKFG